MTSPVISHLKLIFLRPWGRFPFSFPTHSCSTASKWWVFVGEVVKIQYSKSNWDGMKLLNLCLAPNNLIKQNLTTLMFFPPAFLAERPIETLRAGNAIEIRKFIVHLHPFGFMSALSIFLFFPLTCVPSLSIYQ